MNSNGLPNTAQSCFCPLHYTQDVLLKTGDDYREVLDLGKVVGAVKIDLSKALESINHQALLQLLNKYGMRGVEP